MSGGQGSRLLVGQLPQTLSSSWQEAEALKRVSNSSLQTLLPSVGDSGMHRLRDQHRPGPPPLQSPLPLQSFVLPVLNQPSEVKALFVSSGLSQYSRNTEAPLTSSSPSFSSNPGVTCRREERQAGQSRAALGSLLLLHPTVDPGRWLPTPAQIKWCGFF